MRPSTAGAGAGAAAAAACRAVAVVLVAVLLCCLPAVVVGQTSSGGSSIYTTTSTTPYGITYDTNTAYPYLYLVDGSTVKAINTAGALAPTTGSSGVSSFTGLSSPRGIFFTGTSIYVADMGTSGTNNGKIVQFSQNGGTGTTINDHNTLLAPVDVFVDSSSKLYVADTTKVVIIPSSGGTSTITLTGYVPAGIVVDSLNNVYITATTTGTNPTGVVLKVPSTATSVTSANILYSGLNSPKGIILGSNGNLYIANSGASNIVEISTIGALVDTITGTGTGVLHSPYGLTFDTTGNLYVTNPDTTNHNVVRFTPSELAHISATGDPRFNGFWRQSYYVNGAVGDVFSILSDQHVQLNARFVYLSNISCPVLPANETAKAYCASHAGTYFGEFGLMTATATNVDGGAKSTMSGDRLHIRSGPVSEGFHQVTVNGRELAVGQSYGAPPAADKPHRSHTRHALARAVKEAQLAEHAARSTLYVHRTSARSLIVHAGLYEMLIENSDNYADLVQVAVTDWTALLETVQPSGLLGASWNRTATMPPSEEQYRERDGNLMGRNTAAK